jgi:SpoVK/Ycf46/Vps4 family AAA+-type ATPase
VTTGKPVAGSRSALARELVPGRLAGLRVPEGGSLLVVHGAAPWVFDDFVDASLGVRSFEQAMWMWARAAGFERVLFSRRGRAAYSLDGVWERLLQAGPSTEATSRPTRQPTFAGPLGRRWLIPGNALAPAAPPRPVVTRLTDLAAVDLLDAAMRDTTRTALVFLEAEHWLIFNEARRTFAEALTRWVESPPRSGSICVLVFRYEDLGDVLNFGGLREYPTLHAALTSAHRRRERDDPSAPAFRLGPPGRQELEGLLHVHRLTGGLRLENWTELPALLRAMTAAGATIRAWESRFRILEGRDPGGPGPLSLRQLRVRGWVPAHAADGGSAADRLAALRGLDVVKAHIDRLRWDAAAEQQLRAEGRTRDTDAASRHLVFVGNPGTGKTTVARLIGEIYRDLGVLRRGHLVTAEAPDLVAGYVGQSAIRTSETIDRALDGVLFIDEAYRLRRDPSSEALAADLGQEAIDTLLTRMEDDRDRLVVIVAGYPEKMDAFLSSNPGLRSRFPDANRIEFPDFRPEDLLAILLDRLSARGLQWTPPMEDELRRVTADMYERRGSGFGNAREMRDLADDIRGVWATRTRGDIAKPVEPEDVPAKQRSLALRAMPSVDELFREFDDLIGLGPVKEVITDLVARLRLRQRASGRNVTAPHMLFLGNPGTGKTTVARLLGRILCALGVLRTEHVEEVIPRAHLIAGYVGHTAPRTRAAIQRARDGVLFIDEAYSLASQAGTQWDFGREAVDTLVQEMENLRGSLVVVAAGYPAKMEQFLALNPGLSSRFTERVMFPDFSDSELGEILRRGAEREGYTLPPDALDRAARWFSAERRRNPDFGNARDARTLLGRMEARLGRRVNDEPDDAPGRYTFRPEDVPDA